jgi:hypothetical protein
MDLSLNQPQSRCILSLHVLQFFRANRSLRLLLASPHDAVDYSLSLCLIRLGGAFQYASHLLAQATLVSSRPLFK